MNSYQEFYMKYYFPLFESLWKSRNTYQNYKASLQSQWISSDDVRCNQKKLLYKLLNHAHTYCPYYQNIMNDLGIRIDDINSLNDLNMFPILTKDIIRNNFDKLVSIKGKDRIWNKSTGGSTGQPLRFAYTKESYEWRVAMSKRGYAWAGAAPGAKQAYIWGVQLGEVSLVKQMKERLHNIIDRQLYFNCFEFDEKAMSKCLSALNRFKPAAIIGYTNPLYNLALFIRQNSKIKFAPQGVICAAEKVHPYQRDVLETVFGANVFNTYGSREFMLIATECEKHEGLHVSAENIIVEIIKDDGTPAQEGETGSIVVTDLHNFGMPFIRYEIGDLGVATSKKCSCGRGLPLIADVVGRTLDVIKTPEGKVVPGEFFPHLIKDFPDIARFQVTQEKLDHLIIRLVPTTELNRETRQRIESEVRKIVGSTMITDYEIVSDIPLTATGKYRVTISKIGDVHYD